MAVNEVRALTRLRGGAGSAGANRAVPSIRKLRLVGSTMTLPRHHDARPPAWYTTTKRWIEINVAEHDPREVDVEEWVEVWRDSHTDGLVLTAADAVASYPTCVPGHRRALFVADRDLFGELAGAARAAGLRLVAHLDPNVASREVMQTHPDWIQHGPGGELRTLTAVLRGAAVPPPVMTFDADVSADDLFVPCVTGGFYKRFVVEVMTELVDLYQVDGFIADDWPRADPPSAARVCQCARCARLWAARGHRTLPEPTDVDESTWRDYVEFMRDTVMTVQRAWQRHLTRLRADVALIARSGGPEGPLDWDRPVPHRDIVDDDGPDRAAAGTPNGSELGRTVLWAPVRSVGLIQGGSRGAEVLPVVDAWQAKPAVLRCTATGAEQLTVELAEAWAATGGRVCTHVAAAGLPNGDWIDPLVSFYRWSSGVDVYVEHRRSEAHVALVCSASAVRGDTLDLPPTQPSVREAFNGWYLALLRARAPFDVVAEHPLAAADLDQYDCVIVPSGTTLPDRAARALTAFVRSGGALVAGCGTAAKAGGSLLEACARGSLLANAPSIVADGAGLVRVHAWRNPVGLSVCLVNRTAAGPAGGPIHRLVDAGPQKVRIVLERLRDVRRVRLMRRGGLAHWITCDESAIEVEVPSLVDFEMITVDLAS